MSEPLSLYLGPDLPRWLPQSLPDVERIITEGDLAERHWTDVKLVQHFTDSAKKELARDLASFANDGGVLIFGVREDKASGALSVEPVEREGLSERFDQIARSRLDPPLFISTRPIRSDAEASLGILIVEIPASPTAPHQVAVEGAYYGRGDTTRTRLTDGEVQRLHDRRRSRSLSAAEQSGRAMRLDKWPVAQHAHVTVAATPLASPPDLLTSQFSKPNAVLSAIHTAWTAVPNARHIGNTLGYLDTVVPTPAGMSFRSSSYHHGAAAEGRDPEYNAMTVELHDNGTVEFFAGGASKGITDRFGGRSEEKFFVERAVVLVESVVRIAAILASSAGYGGPWLVTSCVTNIGGLTQYTEEFGGRVLIWPVTEDPHLESTETHTIEMLEAPRAVAERVTTRLIRGLGMAEHTEALFTGRR